MAQRRLRDPLERAASRLPGLEREVLVLSARDGLTSMQITERLGIAEQIVEQRLAAALFKFDRELERQERRWWRLW